ncbi:hypothetical protein RIF29_20423 [Crotalaria pallida]|uniref:Replication protein A 70 kDa DNA-binding subunit B/D first OB fold domain-containing protein n=1 Tax=Crotalaria pallida TaxID=3830 RepID=A0AAN9I7G7_CROPI
MVFCLVSDLEVGREVRALQGDKIQVIISHEDAIKKHGKYLLEGEVIQISRFVVAPSTEQFRPTKNPYRLNINFGSKIEVCGENISSVEFDFVSFEEINMDDKPDETLKDIIGVVKEHGILEPYQYKGEVAYKIKLIITDER